MIIMMGQIVLLLPILFGYINCNLLTNPGFEDAISKENWYCRGKCELTQYSGDVKSGTYSVRVSNRSKSYYVLTQDVTLIKNTNYYFEAYIKLLNITSGSLYEAAGANIELLDNDDKKSKVIFCQEPKVTPGRGWIKLAADFITDNQDYKKYSLTILIDEGTVEYLVDDASLTKLEENANWKKEANDRIEKSRKNNVTINLDVSGDYDPANLKLEVKLDRHRFPFGSAVREDQMNGTDTYASNYRKCFFENFEFAVFHNAHKWKQVEKQEGVQDHPFGAMEALNEKKVPMRGHCLFYDRPDNVPAWMRTRTGDDLWTLIHKRLNYTLPRSQYKGIVKDWDLSNEQLHGDFFEKGTDDADFMIKLFNETQKYDPDNLRLFLNDFRIVRDGRSTQAMVNQALYYKSKGAPVGGLGAESHLRGPVTQQNITSFKKRLDMLETVGLPVFLTEIDIDNVTNKTKLADMIDDVVTLGFSHPAVEGLLMWGFHNDTTGIASSAMFEGDDFTPNAAGERWQEMLFTRWRTKKTFNPTSLKQTFEFRGFQGNYTATLTNNGNQIKKKRFYVKTRDKTIDFTT